MAFSAHQMAFGPNTVGPFTWRDDESDWKFSQDTSISGEFVQRRKVRATAREAALEEIANSRLRCVLAYTQSFAPM